MQTAIDRVMRAYVLMVTLTPEDESSARERLEQHLAHIGGDENALAVEGIRFLRASGRPNARGDRSPIKSGGRL